MCGRIGFVTGFLGNQVHYSVFRLEKIFVTSVLYLAHYCHCWWSENCIACLYWQTGLLFKNFTARETLQILAFISYGKMQLSREEHVGRKTEDSVVS